MYVLNITEDYDNIRDKCTITENNIDILLPTLLLTKLCGLSNLCLMSLMLYTLIKPIFKNK